MVNARDKHSLGELQACAYKQEGNWSMLCETSYECVYIVEVVDPLITTHSEEGGVISGSSFVIICLQNNIPC